MMKESIDHYIKDPDLLIELCRNVIDGVDGTPPNSNTSEKEAQLREIARAVEHLEKKEFQFRVVFEQKKRDLRQIWKFRFSLIRHYDISPKNSKLFSKN